MTKKRMKVNIILLTAVQLLTGCAGPGTSTSASPTASVTVSPSVFPSAAASTEPDAASPTPASPSASPESESSPKVPSDSEYEFVTESYEDGEISIHYPQLTGMAESETQNSINEMIKDSALRDLDYIKNEDGKEHYELDYEDMFCQEGYLSIKFTGCSYYDTGAYATCFLNTTNIDMEKESYIGLGDLVTIDESFVELFRKNVRPSAYGEVSTISDPQGLDEYLDHLDECMSETDTAGWVSDMTNADASNGENTGWVYSYFTGDSLVVSVPVPHALGDYIEVYIAYNDLEQYKTGHSLWDAVG